MYLGPFQTSITAQKMKFSIKYFFSKCDQIRSFTFTEEITKSHLLKKSFTENYIFCAVFDEIFCENTQRILAVNFFRKKASLQISERILNRAQ